MNNIPGKSAAVIAGATMFVVTFAWDGQLTSTRGASPITPAYARVGRPLTPVSYAGVARRTTRRTVVATSAAASAAAAPNTTVVVTAPPPAASTQTCTDSVDANGTITRTCY